MRCEGPGHCMSKGFGRKDQFPAAVGREVEGWKLSACRPGAAARGDSCLSFGHRICPPKINNRAWAMPVGSREGLGLLRIRKVCLPR